MSVEEEATGIRNADAYKDYASGKGYTHIKVLNWTSSAGDWQFLISKDGNCWRVMYQENNWPLAGFTYTIDKARLYGTIGEVIEQLEGSY